MSLSPPVLYLAECDLPYLVYMAYICYLPVSHLVAVWVVSLLTMVTNSDN